ncbi:hypothetical protein [Fodinicola acaciae]|uniref:hypothetical protein n=1 Tax=Fodinicola acaciae TaxID=2681555 RepID=UPI0013D670D6|nr:hypothetical protein [Fodinicola acaciae]
MTSPVFRGGDVRGGIALFAGYTVGTGLAAVALLAGVSLMSSAYALISPRLGYGIVAVAVGTLLVLDIFGRTPHLDRQTPQRLAVLPAPVRGLLWGLDIGLLFTTIKVTSLVWVMLVLAVADPATAVAGIAIFYVATLLIEGVAVAADVKLGPARFFRQLQRQGFRVTARVVSAVILGIVLLEVLWKAVTP